MTQQLPNSGQMGNLLHQSQFIQQQQHVSQGIPFHSSPSSFLQGSSLLASSVNTELNRNVNIGGPSQPSEDPIFGVGDSWNNQVADDGKYNIII